MKLEKVEDTVLDDGISFDNILNELNSSIDVAKVGNIEVKPLTLKQQRKIIAGGWDNVDMGAKFSDIYNDFIRENVVITDEVVSVGQVINSETKPYILNLIRVASFGDTYYDDETKKEYKIRPVTAEDLVPKIKDEVIEFGKVKITLSVPNLDKDSKYNALLCIALNPYRKRKADLESLPILDLYQMYEFFKYISKVSYNGKEYDFDNVTMNDKNKMVNILHASIVTKIIDYINRVEDAKDEAFKAVDPESGESVRMQFHSLFVAKTSRKD